MQGAQVGARAQARRGDEPSGERTGPLPGTELAHELNNVLMAILGHAELIEKHAGSQRISRWAQSIAAAAAIAAEIVHQATGTHGRGAQVAGRTELAPAVEQAVALARPRLGEGVAVHLSIPRHLPHVRMSRHAIVQVMLNLLLNAGEAMAGEGTIRISASVSEARGDADLPDVILRVCDDGPGLSPEVAARVFEPSVSTKGPGRGLGLAIVARLVRLAGGRVAAHSEPGAGTAFTLVLPVATSLDAQAEVPGGRPVPSAARSVLLVEDDPAVLGVIKSSLMRAGLTVIAASSGQEARALVTRQPEVVVLDLGMPDADGLELLGELCDALPAAGFIVMTGAADEATKVAVSRLGARLLVKPFSTPQLLRAIEELRTAA